LVSYKTDPDGTQSPYELNCSYIDALTHPDERDDVRYKRMMLAQGTVLAMPGVPGIYFHSLVGSRNYKDGVKHTGVNRTINREKYNIDWLEKELSIHGSLPKKMLASYKRLISIRINEPAFNPFGKFEFLELGDQLFAVDQHCVNNRERIVVVHNFSDEEVDCQLPENISLPLRDLVVSSTVVELLSTSFTLKPYQMMWLKGKL
jgi:sucrose phosphorylase